MWALASVPLQLYHAPTRLLGCRRELRHWQRNSDQTTCYTQGLARLQRHVRKVLGGIPVAPVHANSETAAASAGRRLRGSKSAYFTYYCY